MELELGKEEVGELMRSLDRLKITLVDLTYFWWLLHDDVLVWYMLRPCLCVCVSDL